MQELSIIYPCVFLCIITACDSKDQDYTYWNNIENIHRPHMRAFWLGNHLDREGLYGDLNLSTGWNLGGKWMPRELGASLLEIEEIDFSTSSIYQAINSSDKIINDELNSIEVEVTNLTVNRVAGLEVKWPYPVFYNYRCK